MSSNKSKMATLRGALLALGLLAGSGAALAQSAVTLTAAPATATLPDGQGVPMWGYSCTAASGTNVSCAALNTLSTGWSPVIIRVPAGALTITLVNNLPVPTSLVIDGQLGGGLGDAPSRMDSPVHAPYGTTWPGTAGTADAGSCSNGTFGDTGTFCPPSQIGRVRSFGTEVAPGTTNSTLAWANLRPGTYLIHTGTEPSIQHPMGLYGVLVVADPSGTAYGTAFDGDVPVLMSEIDPAQNSAVAAAVAAPGFDERATWAGPGMCKDPTTGQPVPTSTPIACYPPAVNYSPRYYLINGTSFDRSNLAASTLAGPAAAATSGNVLLRLVNAGQRLHVPAVVGADMTLLAEDGNTVPGGTRVQSSIPMPPGKTFDATIQPVQGGGSYTAATLPVYDRQLSLSTNNQRDGGMQAYIAVAGGAATGAGSAASQSTLTALDPTYTCVAGTTLSVSQVSKGVLAGATGASGVGAPTASTGAVTIGASGNLVLNSDGTFTYAAPAAPATCGGNFTYLVNGTQSHTATIVECDAAVQGSGCALSTAPVANAATFTSQVSSRYASAPPGLLASVTNDAGLALTANAATNVAGGTVTVNPDGSFVATPSGTGPVTFDYTVTNSQGTVSNSATATVNFMAGSGLAVTVLDGPSGFALAKDYRWIIEEDRTFWIDPKCQVNQVDSSGNRPTDSYGRACPPLPVESLGYNFHSAHMPVIAQGCVGSVSCEAGQMVQGADAICDVGNGACRAPATGEDAHKANVSPADVALDPNKHYYISILPGDAINPTVSGFSGSINDCAKYSAGAGDATGGDWSVGTGNCGHEMGGAQIAPGQTSVTINLQQIPLPTAKISVFVFEDDNPLNGENDAGGGVDVIAPNEPGLGGFELKLFDQAGQLGDNTGQITYDEFNEPVTNSLAGYIDPTTGKDACPISALVSNDVQSPGGGTQAGIIGMIPTCPKYESDGTTPSPLAGQAVINNLYPGLYEVQAYPAADRIARGEEWLQTNTLDGGKPHEAFIIPNEPGYFQEFGPGGYHVAIGFANPAIINARKAGYCASSLNTSDGVHSLGCDNTLTVEVSNNHMSRTPDQRTFGSESYDHYAFTQCYVSIGPSDSEDFAFEPCVMTTGTDGKTHATATFTGMPPGTFKMTVFDQWNDIMLDGLVGTVQIASGDNTKSFPVTQWRTNLYTRTYIDTDGSGVSDDSKPGLSLVNTNIRYRDGSIGFFNNTDLNGYAGFNEVFPLMNWLVVDTTQTRFKPTWTHVIYDAGGPVDGSDQSAALAHTPGWSVSTGQAANLANTDVRVPLPADLRVPGAKYCDNADCPAGDAGGGASTGMLFPNQAFSNSIGWQGLLGQNTFIEFGVKPFKKATATTPAENGGIHGQVIYASTRPFDDPSLLLQLSWEPGIPNATVNLYSKTVDAQGNEVLKLVDTTQTASWDDWAQGFRKGADGSTLVTAGTGTQAGYVPNMNCPGQANDSPFFATLKNSKEWLDAKDPANHGSTHDLAYNSQFKCYDGWSQLNQAQPAPYDGYYGFPSITAIDPATGKPSATNCKACTTNPDDGSPMLPAGTYVVEVIPPAGYEMVKEEDKNILMGDVYVAPVTQQFAGFGNIYIMPDQAAVGSAYNGANPGNLNQTTDLGSKNFPRHEGDTGSVETFWNCVGALRQVPDFNSEFPGAQQAAPFAGAMRHLCDRKEVTVADESASLAKFYLFSSTHIAGHFTGTITNDFASEFDPFSPQFGEKFGPPNLPVGLRDFNGNQVARVYSDQWGIYNGLFYSTWSPNPPNPTGYAPQMSIACMNDPGPINIGTADAPNWVTDPAYNPAYSNFCYEQPFMPGETTYMDTPVIPTQSFADGYNLPDTEFPDGTPAIKTVYNSLGTGPWVDPDVPEALATVSFTIGGVDNNTTDRITNVRVGNTQLITTQRCGTNVTCTGTNFTARNLAMAQAVAANINADGTGYTASAASTGGGNNSSARVTITAPTGSGASANALQLSVANAGVTINGSGLRLAGGVSFHAGTTSADLVVTALGDKVVQNPHFAGPNATQSPYNQKTITRHYGFGSGGTATLVAPDGSTSVALATSNWNDASFTATVPALPAAFNCRVQQRGAGTSQCGQLVIARTDNGKQSIDAVTVTVGGSAPWVVTPTGVTAPAGKTVKDYGSKFGRLPLVLQATNQDPIQVAIDSASPGDLILVEPGTYRENLIMWKPVRLQGVGASSVTVNADAHPAGHMDQWRRQMVCVFGLTLDGIPNLGNDQAAFDKSGQYGCPDEMFLKGDRIPFEAITGWQAAGNGNLAQVLQEPTLMGAYEGAGITVVGRGVRIPANSTDFWGNDPTAAGAFPDGAVYLTNGNTDCTVPGSALTNGRDYGTSNFRCNPSSIDGLSVINSSQGGGGIFVHGWAHYLEIGNDRISANHGTLAGAINIGNGETPPVFVNDGTTCGAGVAALCPPIGNTANGAAIPFGFDTFVRVHNNMLWNNASIGDALFTGTPAGAGAVTVSAGGDNYSIDHNWIAGNLSTGDGGGIQQLGVNFNGRIDHNVVMFNQSTNPTLPTNGGGLVVQGANEPRTLNGTECGGATDTDCPPGLGDGTGAGLVIDSNLFYGNSAESGTGGGIALEMVNGSEVVAFPTAPNRWYGVTLTNNIVANNVAGYDGGGISLRDTLKASLVNNTIVSNDTTASAGALFKTLGAINASSPPPGCNAQTDPTLPQDASCLGADAPHGPQPAGLVTMAHTQNLNDAIAGLAGSLTSNNNPKLVCPGGYGYANGSGNGNNALNNADCLLFSRPNLVNDMFWQNRTFQVEVVVESPAGSGNFVPASTAQQSQGATGTGLLSQQNLIALFPAYSNTQLAAQAASGSCTAGATYWDIGLRTDDVQAGLLTAAANKLAITNSLLTGVNDIGTAQETVASGSNRYGVANQTVVGQICNGARVPPEMCAGGGDTSLSGAASCKGYNVPAGASETTSTSTLFVFNGIQPTATVDEGHNWLNLSYGPLTLARPGESSASAGEQMVAGPATGTSSGAYSITAASPAVGGGTTNGAPAVDFYGNPRSGRNDIGAVQVDTSTAQAILLPGSVSFGEVVAGSAATTQTLTLQNNGGALAGLNVSFTGTGFARQTGNNNAGGTCRTTLAANASCTIVVRYTPGAVGDASGTVSVTTTTAGVTITNSPASLSATVVPPVLKASVTPGTLAFANQVAGSTSAALTLTVSNTGNGALGGLAVAFGGGAPQPFSRPNGNAGGSCGTTLAVGASCTINVVFSPAANAGASSFSRTLTVTATGATVTPSPVQLTGSSVPPSTVSLAPNPLVISLARGTLSGTGTVTFTNTGAAGGSPVAVAGVAVNGNGGSFFGGTAWAFSKVFGGDNCSGTTLAPGGSCTVNVRFSAGNNGRPVSRSGTIVFTDNGVGSPQTWQLTGNAN